MSESIDQFFIDYQQELLTSAEIRGDFQLTEFVEKVADDIRENGDLEGFEPCHWDSGRGSRVDGYWFDDEGTLSLFIADFDFRDRVESLTQSEVNSAFRRIENFFDACLTKQLYSQFEESSAVFGLARQIADRGEGIKSLRIFLVSERRLSDRAQTIPDHDILGRNAFYEVWDIDRLHRQRQAKGQREPLEIDFVSQFGRGLQCIKAPLGTSEYTSYLTVIPGTILADLYQRYGSRLLESNVRSFLQNRANVNKGIRSTILKEPLMFFAFNNGITATASDVTLESGYNGLILCSITDLQIVNGGQTTASLFHTRRNDGAKLHEVFVQMKLSVVDQKLGEQIVPRIAEYANTQNKVNVADLFSNSPFHIRMESYSRKLFTKPVKGAVRGTKWFYERSRGQYRDEMSKRSVSEGKKFGAEYPKHQMFTKTDLAKFENVWDEHPRFVNQGAQANFVKYANRIATEWQSNSEAFNEFYFKRAVARAIVFRQAERMVSEQSWYEGGYRANIVAYGVALIGEIARRSGQAINSMEIWDLQDLPDALAEALKITTRYANSVIRNPAPGNSNASQWAKREACWTRITELVPEVMEVLPQKFFDSLISRVEERLEEKDAKVDQVLQDGIMAVSTVLEVSAVTWQEIREQLVRTKSLTDKEDGILRIVAKTPPGFPTDKQAKVLVDLLKRGENEGIRVKRNT